MRRIIVLLVLVMAGLGGIAGWYHYRTSRYDEMIEQAAVRNGLDFYLVKAVVFEESWFRHDIRGSSGEIGLMQVTRGAASDFCVRKSFPPLHDDRLLEPELNLEIGCWYLRQSIDRYKNSPHPVLFGLLRYNAGQVRSDAWLKEMLSKPLPPGISLEQFYVSLVDLPNTREYVRAILRRSRTHNYYF